MSVWYCIPSKRPPEEARKCLQLWADQGYNIALFCDDPGDLLAKEPQWPEPMSSMAQRARFHGITAPYPGYAQAVNALALMILRDDPTCEWIVSGGDDLEPDANHTAEEIAQQCAAHFSYLNEVPAPHPKATFGVMQPSGDRYGESAGSIATYGADRAAYADRVCGSPWIGREFALRINQGKGPLWPGFTHMFEDECLQAVATKLGVLWQRRDLIHYHRHWARARGDVADMPDFLKHVNSPQHWQESKAEFERLKASDFAECMPI